MVTIEGRTPVMNIRQGDMRKSRRMARRTVANNNRITDLDLACATDRAHDKSRCASASREIVFVKERSHDKSVHTSAVSGQVTTSPDAIPSRVHVILVVEQQREIVFKEMSRYVSLLSTECSCSGVQGRGPRHRFDTLASDTTHEKGGLFHVWNTTHPTWSA